jgi:hypothetical protein
MKQTRRLAIGLATTAAVASLMVSATGSGAGAAPERAASTESAGLPGDDIRINEIQTVGSHNSYHVTPSPAEVELRRTVVGAEAAGRMEYEHLPLGQQFEEQKVRQIELDVFLDDAGGRYANPLMRSFLGLADPLPAAWSTPGLKVFHVQDVDYATTCVAFADCLTAVKTWSDAHPSHVPIAILLELKDTPLVLGDLPFVVPEQFDAAAMDQVDAAIRSVFSPDDLITPDDVRGSHDTLPLAIASDGWPTLGESRGKVMFLMDNGGSYRTTYLRGTPNLAGKPVFTTSSPGAADAAFLKRNDALDPAIPGLVRDGYLVRTRADAETIEARNNDTTLRDAALASGAHWVSTDYPVPNFAFEFETDYFVEIPGGTVARCNPVNGPVGCVDADLDQPTPPSTTSTTTTAPSTSTTAGPGSTSTSVAGGGTNPPPATPAQPIRGVVRFVG